MSSLLQAIDSQIEIVEELRHIAIEKLKKAQRQALLIFFTVTIIGLLVLLFVSPSSPPPPPVFIFPVILGGIAAFITHLTITGDSRRAFAAAYKTNIIGGIAKHLQPEIAYFPSSGISQQVFNSLGHYSRPDRYHTEDLFEGTIGATSISFSEAKAEQKYTTTDSEGNTTTHWRTLFMGLIFCADFHKDFHTTLTISPDSESDGFFGRIAQKFQAFGGNLVKLEDPEFEKHFLVRCSDDVQARYILTPDMQQRLLELRRAVGAQLRISMHSSTIYITIPKSTDWFEADLHTSTRNPAHLESIASQMNFLFQIVEILNLNTRIWTKS